MRVITVALSSSSGRLVVTRPKTLMVCYHKRKCPLNKRPLVNANQTTQEDSSLDLSTRLARALRKPGALTPLILLMGFIGASLRYVLETMFPANNGFPFSTLIVNIFGCFVLEIINQYVGRRLHLPPPLVKSLGIGLIGAFTTIAAFSAECLSFFHEGAFALACVYIAATIVTTFISALAGRITAQLLALRRFRRLRKQHAVERAFRKERFYEVDLSSSTPLSSFVSAPSSNEQGNPLKPNDAKSIYDNNSIDTKLQHTSSEEGDEQ